MEVDPEPFGCVPITITWYKPESSRLEFGSVTVSLSGFCGTASGVVQLLLRQRFSTVRSMICLKPQLPPMKTIEALKLMLSPTVTVIFSGSLHPPELLGQEANAALAIYVMKLYNLCTIDF